MRRWLWVAVVMGLVLAALGGCASAPSPPVALGVATTAPSTIPPPTPITTATRLPSPTVLPATPPASPSSPPTPSPSPPPILPTQPVQRIPMPAPRTPMPAPTGSTPRVVLLPTPWRLMDDAAFGERARADLAQRLNLAPDAVEVVRVTRGDVPIGVFNCTARRTPDKVPYTQPAFVMAVEVVLRAGGREVTYYAQGQRLITCDLP